MNIRQGTRVVIKCAGEAAEGTVVLCSENQQSLMVQLDEGMWTAHGLYCDLVPLLMTDDGKYRELIGDEPVEIAAPPS